MRNKKSLIMFLFFLLILTILFFFYFPEVKKELLLLKKVQVQWLLGALTCQLMTYIFTGQEYLILLKTYRLPKRPGIHDLSKAAIISLCFNQTVPSAGISGNLFYFQFLKRFDISRGKIFSLIIAELLIYYFSMEVFIIFLLLLFYLDAWSSVPLKTTLLSGLAIYPLLGGLIMLANKKGIFKSSYKKVMQIKWLKRILLTDQQEVHVGGHPGIGVMIKNYPFNVLKAVAFKVLITIADISTIYAIFLGIGYPTSPLYILAAIVGTNIISLLPFSPGALILYESSMTYLFVSQGIPLSPAIIATLVYRLLSFWLPIPIGTLLYRQWFQHKTLLKS